MIQFCIIISKMCAGKPSVLGPNKCEPIGNHSKLCKAGMKPPWNRQAQNIEFQHCRETLTAHMIQFCTISVKDVRGQTISSRAKSMQSHWKSYEIMQSGHETTMKPSRPRISNLSFAVKLWLHTWSHLHHSSIDVRGQTITSTTNTLNLGAAFEFWPRTWFNFAS